MSRLIDADKLLNKIDAYMCGSQDVMFVKELIKQQPTAFDVDKVVEQLEEKRFKTNWFMANIINDTTRFPIERNRAFAYDTAIEIVKAGGIDED